MAERAAHLVDHVIPDVPVRQRVLSLSYRLRHRLARGHDLCRLRAGGIDPWTDEAPALAGLAAASVQGLVALRGARRAPVVAAGGYASPVVRSGSRDGDGRSRGRRWSRRCAGHRATPGAWPAVIGRILRHLDRPTDLPVAGPARAPPLLAAAGAAQADEYESAPERRLLAVAVPEVCPIRRPGVLNGASSRLDTAAAGAIIGAFGGRSANRGVLIGAVCGVGPCAGAWV
jgi:hypothetical protein